MGLDDQSNSASQQEELKILNDIYCHLHKAQKCNIWILRFVTAYVVIRRDIFIEIST